jgi:hypothetical protein
MTEHRVDRSQPEYDGEVPAAKTPGLSGRVYSCGSNQCFDHQVKVQAEKDSAYAERNKLVAFLSRLYPAHRGWHEGDDWEDDWRNIIFINTPAGQLSWHIHNDEVEFFDHIPFDGSQDLWDGHTTEEKYERLRMLP